MQPLFSVGSRCGVRRATPWGFFKTPIFFTIYFFFTRSTNTMNHPDDPTGLHIKSEIIWNGSGPKILNCLRGLESNAKYIRRYLAEVLSKAYMVHDGRCPQLKIESKHDEGFSIE